MPAATPTLAFCFTTLPSPGIARVQRAEQLLTSWVLRRRARPDRAFACGTHFIEHFFHTKRRNDLFDTGDRHLQFAVETAARGQAQGAGGETAIRSPC